MGTALRARDTEKGSRAGAAQRASGPPKLSGPAKVPGALRERRVQALLLPDLARPRRASVSRRWGRQRGSGLLPAVGESHSHDSARCLARWRGRRGRADPGPGLAPPLEPRRAAGEAERDFPGRGETGGGGASLTGVAVSGLPKLMLNCNYFLSGGAGAYPGSCVTGEETGWSESRFSIY